MSTKQLPIPSFFKRGNAGDWGYQPNAQDLSDFAVKWRKQHSILPSGSDKVNVHLLQIDPQKDFCFPPPQGALYVGGRSGKGAIDDNTRLAEFIYRNLGVITTIKTTMDTHFPYQIFSAAFWADADGNPLQSHTKIILSDDEKFLINATPAGEVLHENVQPNPAIASWLSGNYTWLCKQVKFYVQKLKEMGKYELYLWPPHCLIGGDGHALAGVIQEARLFHAYVRGMDNPVEIKGGNFLTENYSVLNPEVLERFDGKPLTQKNVKFIETLLKASVVIIAGQAKSHCVAWTIDNLLTEIKAQDETLAKKVYLLEDCTSSVVVPNVVDFTDLADQAFKRFADAGMHVVKSTDPIDSWPDISL